VTSGGEIDRLRLFGVFMIETPNQVFFSKVGQSTSNTFIARPARQYTASWHQIASFRLIPNTECAEGL
jgi:hypothetical protein